MPFTSAAARTSAYEWFGEAHAGMPTLVFLHEGLGSIRQWRDFPAQVATASGCRALVYDRYGYGQSDVLEERSEEHTSELQSRFDLVCRLLLEKKKFRQKIYIRKSNEEVSDIADD